MLLNTCATHQITNGFVDEMLLLHNSILGLKFNNLLGSDYEVKKLVQNLALWL